MTLDDFIEQWLIEMENTLFRGFFSANDEPGKKYMRMENAHKQLREKLSTMLAAYDSFKEGHKK
jgi:hypothetical protein